VNREQWLAHRRKGLGSSDAAAVCNLSAWRTPLHVYLDKLGQLADCDSGPKRWGRRLEDVVALAYQEETGRPVYRPARPMEWHPHIPWMFASLDRLTEVNGQGRLLEIKTSRFGDEWGAPGTDDIPAQYLVQVQHQLAVTGVRLADVAVLIGGQELQVYEVERDERLISNLTTVLADFWAKVERREPPEPTWQHAGTLDLMHRLHKVEGGREVSLGEESLADVRGYLDYGGEISRLKRLRDECQARLIHAMGEAETARVGVAVISRRATRSGQRRFLCKEVI
jgi:putative phage-type endonuclease